MKKIIVFLLCCGVLVGMAGYGGNTAPPPTESPPTTVSETIITEAPTETIPPITAVEPTEKEKEPTTPLAQFCSHSYKQPVPYGNTLIMSPWNYPFLLTLDPLADAENDMTWPYIVIAVAVVDIVVIVIVAAKKKK